MYTVDKNYCMSSFLMFRTIIDKDKCFANGVIPYHVKPPVDRMLVHNSDDLYHALKTQVEKASKGGKVALALSGGIDSAILAKFMPKGSTAYTFKCVVPGISVTDESMAAAKYAKECGLKHKVIEIYWEDMEKYAPVLMKHKGAPIHSIECQIYKAALQAKEDGFQTMIFGESADIIYGGHSNLLSRDWTLGEFVQRYSYVLPYYGIKESNLVMEPFTACVKDDGMIDVYKFNNKYYFDESINSYENACKTAGIKLLMPFSRTILGEKLDLDRIRRGENKYLVREVFTKLYSSFAIPPKTPMPRPMNEWLANWNGPQRTEFWSNCAINLTGDQKWLLWSLERFLDILEDERIING